MRSRSKKCYDQAALYDYAIAALGRQMRSVAELKRLLRRRALHTDNAEPIIEAVISRLKEQRYLNDTQYAAAFTSYRKENEKLGQRRVVQELRAKGVHPDVIEKAVRGAYAGLNEEKLAREFLHRKRLRKPASQKEAARIFRALTRAGFSSNVIFKVLKKWDVGDEVLTALNEPEDENAASSETAAGEIAE